MTNRTLAALCLAGAAVAIAIIAGVAFWGADKWGFPFVAIGLAVMFLLAFVIEFLERRATSQNRQEVIPPDRPHGPR
jgi:hypothetical protein